MKKNKKPTRAIRKRRKKSGNNGFVFFITMLFVLFFALAYYFDLPIPGLKRDILFSAEGEIIVTFLDVGQGDSIVIRTNENAVLIDAGEHKARNIVRNYLEEAGIKRLDYVIATHPHSDHIGGLVTILNHFEIGSVLMPEITHDSQTFENLLDVILNNDINTIFPLPGDIFTAGIIELTTISPPPNEFRDLNNNSLVMRMEHGQTSFLFTGDAEKEAEEWMLSSGENLRSNVLKVGHHGSRTSSTEEFLNAVRPSIAVIQSGENQWGHPHDEVLQRLESRNISIYRNDQLGTIRMITDGERVYFP